MSAAPSEFEKTLRVNNKDFFVDLKSNEFGKYVKISERSAGKRNTLLVPVEGVEQLISVLKEAVQADRSAARTRTPANDRVVFVSGFPKDTAEADVVAFMSTAGVISGVDMKGKGKFVSALVEYSTPEAAAIAVGRFNETMYLGDEIRCRADKGSTEKAPRSAPVESAGKKKGRKEAAEGGEPKEVDTMKVWCDNLTYDTTSEQLIVHFSAAGAVKSVAINTRRNGRSAGSAVVEFQSATSVHRALAQLNGVPLDGRELRVREYFIE